VGVIALYVTESQELTKSVVTCTTMVSLEADDMVALELFDQYPFQVIAKVVNATNRLKQVAPPKKEDHSPVITSFMKKLGGAPQLL
jgi:hypothetical protein